MAKDETKNKKQEKEQVPEIEELTDSELEEVAGGRNNNNNNKPPTNSPS